jgi:hypothetical protein
MQTLLVGGLLYIGALIIFVLSRPSHTPAGITLVQEEKVRT